MTTHVLYFTGNISSSTCGILISCCQQALNQGATELYISMSSAGGENNYGFTIYNYLKALPIPVNTHNIGTVESMGNIMFLAGKKRSACPDSRFLFHQFHWNMQGGIDHHRVLEHGQSLSSDLERYSGIVHQRTDGANEALDVKRILLGESKIISPREAIEYGLISEVKDLTFDASTPSWWVHG